MITVNVHDAKTRLSALLAEVEERGTWVRICRNGKPVADLRPAATGRDPFARDPELGPIEFIEDPVLPLRPEDWPDPV